MVSRIRRLPVVALLTLVAVLPACGDDEPADEASDTSATSTTLPDEALSSVALSDFATEQGEALLAADVGRAWANMSIRCREMVDRDELTGVLAALKPPLQFLLKPDVDVNEVEVTGALTGEIADGRGEAAVQLNEEIFKKPEYAVFPMAPYVFEFGEWRYDACEQLLSVGARATTTSSVS